MMTVGSPLTEADDPLSQQQMIHWAQELDTIVVGGASAGQRGNGQATSEGVRDTVASLKQHSPVKRTA